MHNHSKRWLSVGIVVLMPLGVAAQTVTTDSFDVRITIAAECEVVSTQPLDFGTEGVLSGNVDNQTALEVTCTDTTPYNIGLNEGLGAAATTTVRQMTAAGETVDYALFQDTGRSVNWGDTVGTDTLAATGTGAVQEHVVYGRVPAQDTPAPGTYTDTVTVTVTY